MLDQLSLVYYQSKTKAYWLDLIVICVLILTYNIFCKIVFGLEIQQKDTTSNTILIDNILRRDTSLHTNYKEKVSIIVLCLFYAALFILCTLLVIVSIIVDYLPRDNTLRLNNMQTRLVETLLPFVLTFNTSIIIPKLIDSMYRCYQLCGNCLCNYNQDNTNINDTSFSPSYSAKYRSTYILFLRTLSIIVIPFISSLIIIPNCGNNWFYFWRMCDNDKKHQFDIYLLWTSKFFFVA